MAAYRGLELMKICYDEEDIETMLPERIGIWNKAKKWTEGRPAAGGQYFEFFVETTRPSGGGWMDSNGQTWTPTGPSGVTGRVYPRLFHFPMEFTSFDLELSANDVRAYKSSLEFYRDTLMTEIARRRCLAIYGNHYGIQAFIGADAAVPTATHRVRGMYGFTDGAGTLVIWGAEIFEQGDKVCIINGATGALIQATTVVSTTPANPVAGTMGTVTFADAFAASATNYDFITFGESLSKCDYSATGRAPTGFADLFNIGEWGPAAAPFTGTYENIPITGASAAPRWKPSVYTGATAGVPESLDSSHLTKVILGPSTQAGRKINVLVMNDALMQSWMNYFEQQVHFTPQNFEGGMREVTWALPGHENLSVFFDAIAPHGCIIGLSEDKLRRFEAKKPGWENKAGSEFALVQGSLAYYAVWTEGWSWGTKARSAHSIHRDIREEVSLVT